MLWGKSLRVQRALDFSSHDTAVPFQDNQHLLHPTIAESKIVPIVYFLFYPEIICPFGKH